MEREQLMGKFLYGGVTLPAKPDYDETVFPCAYMQNSNTLIVVSAVGYIIKDTEGNATGMRSADGTNLIYSAWTCDDGETWTPLTVERETSTVAAANVFWSNTDDHISLEPENPQYRPIVLWGEEMNTVRILGKAVAFTSAVR